MTKQSAVDPLDRGGPTNLTGIHYQLLVTFREASSAVRVERHKGKGARLVDVTLVIEPRGGGDTSFLQDEVHWIQQIKLRSRPWSLSQLVEKVLPDLFRSYCSNPGVSRVELVTNGRLAEKSEGFGTMLEDLSSRWQNEHTFPDGQEYLLPWFKQKEGSRNASATLDDLIDYLAVRLPEPKASTPIGEAEHRKRIKEFLVRLYIRSGRTFEGEEHECREFLLGRGIAPGEIDGIIYKVVGFLLSKGHPGNQAVTFGDITLELRLADYDLSGWNRLGKLSRECLLEDLARSPGYAEAQDVRHSDPLAAELLHLAETSEVVSGAGLSPSRSPLRVEHQPIVLWGKSGIGKTWLLARAASKLASKLALATTWQGPALVWLPSRQDPSRDLEAAAEKFCHQLWGFDRAIPMVRLAQRVKRVVANRPIPWLVVFIDNVQSQDYLEGLGELQHSELGVLLVIALTAQFGDVPRQRRDLRLLRAPSFSSDEVLTFLQRQVPSQSLPPVDVRRLLETPVISALYSDLKRDGSAWQPEDEYGLVHRYWLKRIVQSRSTSADRLARLSCARLRRAMGSSETPSEGHSSWTVAELTDAGFSQTDLDELERSGILVSDDLSRIYTFGQERIFQWAAAEGALRAFQAQLFHLDELAQICVAIMGGESKACRNFGYVPADLLWLLLDTNLPERCRQAAETVLGALETHHNFIRLEDWLSTLGGRSVSILFTRLRSAGSKNSGIRYTYRDALQKIPSAQVAQLATKLLREPALELQEVGVLLLEKRAHPPALDALWNLYQYWWDSAHPKGPQEVDRRKEPGLYHIYIGKKALRRSVRNEPQWLERKLLDSPSLGGANSTLLFLLASTPRGELVWKRLKEILRGRLAEDQQWGFIRCVISFRDHEEVPWLETKVNEPRDHVAPSARGALALLAPERALAEVDPAAELELAFGRGRWLPLIRIQRPLETARFFSELVLRSQDPIKTAFRFRGSEFWFSVDIIEILIETVKEALAGILRREVKPGKDHPLYALLSQLSDFVTLDQLEFLWDGGRAQLDSDLADWLSEQGVNDTRMVRDHSEGEAGEVLKLMAGQGMTRTARSFLEQARTWTGGLDGLDLAVREPDLETLATIRHIALDPIRSERQTATDYPNLQLSCVMALAYLRDLEGFSRGIVQWGLEIPPDAAEYLDQHRGAPQLLELAKQALTQTPIPPGAFHLLGFHGGAEAVVLLQQQAQDQLSTTDLMIAQIRALDDSRDCSSETYEIFARGLESADDKLHLYSRRALSHRFDDPKARRLLQAAFEGKHGDSEDLAGLFLDWEPTRRAVAERLWRGPKDWWFLFYFGAQLEYLAVLGTEEVQTFLLDQATRNPDPETRAARYSAIRGLLLFDRNRALRAALACRNTESGRAEDRDWPALVLEVGGSDALPYLRTELAESHHLVRLYTLGEALREKKQVESLHLWLQDEDPRVREGACLASCAQAYDSQLEEKLKMCCLDRDEDVRDAAQRAFANLSSDREVARLIGRLRTEPRSGRRWALIDAALAIGYPGVRPGFGQVSWFSQLVAGRPYYEFRYATKRLKEKRKKLTAELEERSKRFREAQ